jgi:hypothetical protein
LDRRDSIGFVFRICDILDRKVQLKASPRRDFGPWLWSLLSEAIDMRKIRKKILTDSAEKPIAVQIEYTDWLEIERFLNLEGEDVSNTDLSSYQGVITLTEDPLEYQSRIRQEWS